jgi:hypothetical protein
VYKVGNNKIKGTPPPFRFLTICFLAFPHAGWIVARYFFNITAMTVMKKILIAILLAQSFCAQALTQITAVPSDWVLYWTVADGTDPSLAYFTKTGSTCYPSPTALFTRWVVFDGAVTSVDDQRLFFNTALAAKVAGTSVMVKYDETNNCVIKNFGLN